MADAADSQPHNPFFYTHEAEPEPLEAAHPLRVNGCSNSSESGTVTPTNRSSSPVPSVGDEEEAHDGRVHGPELEAASEGSEDHGPRVQADPVFAFFQALVDARVEVVAYPLAEDVQPVIIIEPPLFRAVIMKAIIWYLEREGVELPSDTYISFLSERVEADTVIRHPAIPLQHMRDLADELRVRRHLPDYAARFLSTIFGNEDLVPPNVGSLALLLLTSILTTAVVLLAIALRYMPTDQILAYM